MPSNDSRVLSHLGLRRAIGIIGLCLPFVLALGKIMVTNAAGLEPTISDYYHTVMRDVFVGALSAIAVFLFCYRYDTADTIAGMVSGFCALGTALCPTTPLALVNPYDELLGTLHYLFASGFFLSLAYFSLVLFRMSGQEPTPEKRIRNRVYTVCGYSILVCLAGIVLAKTLIPTDRLLQLDIIFWLESTAIFAFGTAWLIKGETLIRDR